MSLLDQIWIGILEYQAQCGGAPTEIRCDPSVAAQLERAMLVPTLLRGRDEPEKTAHGLPVIAEQRPNADRVDICGPDGVLPWDLR